MKRFCPGCGQPVERGVTFDSNECIKAARTRAVFVAPPNGPGVGGDALMAVVAAYEHGTTFRGPR